MKVKKVKQPHIKSIIEINYSEPLTFLRENKNHFTKTETLISALETLEAVSYYYKNSKFLNKENIIFECLYTSETDIQKAIKELESVINVIPSGILIKNILNSIIIYRKNSLMIKQ